MSPLPFLTIKAIECPVQDRVHEAEHLPPLTNTNVTLLVCQPSTIMAARKCIAREEGSGGGKQAVVRRWDVALVDTPYWTPT